MLDVLHVSITWVGEIDAPFFVDPEVFEAVKLFPGKGTCQDADFSIGRHARDPAGRPLTGIEGSVGGEIQTVGTARHLPHRR